MCVCVLESESTYGGMKCVCLCGGCGEGVCDRVCMSVYGECSMYGGL